MTTTVDNYVLQARLLSTFMAKRDRTTSAKKSFNPLQAFKPFHTLQKHNITKSWPVLQSKKIEICFASS